MKVLKYLYQFPGAFLVGITITLLAAILATILLFDPVPEKSKPKIGFIILGDVNAPGWNASQYQGIKKASDKLGAELIYRDNVKENTGQCPLAIKELAELGCKMIFLCSYSYSKEARDCLEAYPHLAFATNSAEVHTRNMTAYFVRLYQARFLAGALAGLMTKTQSIGYVAAMENSEVNRGINAFVLGVKKTNPHAQVYVAFTQSWANQAVEEKLVTRLKHEAKVDVLTYHQDDLTVPKTAEKEGIYFIGYNTKLTGYSQLHLASILCRWDIYYYNMIQRFLKGELNTVKNHWLGIEYDAVSLEDFSTVVSKSMLKQISTLKDQLKDNKLIFQDEIFDNKGILRCKKGEALSDDILLEKIDWLIEGVKVLD
ncbi:MAG: BMP family ABC transporter substrate-binding protein [Desulfovibrionaceae bacterium]|nr:BMP family ABC transporter substrate-binding protein [Desulfovibrionaceae bacterium]